MKRHAPATLRNRDAIAEILARELPESGTVLEVASGSGEHAVFFAAQFPALQWQPSDADPEALASIAEYRAEAKLPTLREPISLNAAEAVWNVPHAGAIVCINMVHISPWAAAEGLFHGASKCLKAYAPLILYGPYFERGADPAPSNLEFDASLKSRNPLWGIRQVADVTALAQKAGFTLSARYAMPANNLMLVYRRAE